MIKAYCSSRIAQRAEYKGLQRFLAPLQQSISGTSRDMTRSPRKAKRFLAMNGNISQQLLRSTTVEEVWDIAQKSIAESIAKRLLHQAGNSKVRSPSEMFRHVACQPCEQIPDISHRIVPWHLAI
jgi:hypothetical protein